MGARLPQAGSDLWQEYAAKIEDLQRCCYDPAAPGCIVEPIENLKQWLKRNDTALKP
jgi:hypothetical protein